MKKRKRPAPQIAKNQRIEFENEVCRRADASSKEGLSDLLDYVELARITRKSVVTLRRYTMLGIGPTFLRIGRHVRFRREDVLTWLDSCTQSVGAHKS